MLHLRRPKDALKRIKASWATMELNRSTALDKSAHLFDQSPSRNAPGKSCSQQWNVTDRYRREGLQIRIYHWAIVMSNYFTLWAVQVETQIATQLDNFCHVLLLLLLLWDIAWRIELVKTERFPINPRWLSYILYSSAHKGISIYLCRSTVLRFTT
jgi:hypothetical protein